LKKPHLVKHEDQGLFGCIGHVLEERVPCPKRNPGRSQGSGALAGEDLKKKGLTLRVCDEVGVAATSDGLPKESGLPDAPPAPHNDELGASGRPEPAQSLKFSCSVAERTLHT